MNLLESKTSKFQNLKNEIDPNNLTYKYKTEGRGPKNFSNYQNLVDLFTKRKRSIQISN